jgi:hypothetical protein
LRGLGYQVGDLDEMADEAARSPFNARAAFRPTRTDFKAMILEALG